MAIFWSNDSLNIFFFDLTIFLKIFYATKNLPRRKGSKGNLDTNFPSRSTSFLSSKQDLSNHGFCFFLTFFDFFEPARLHLTGKVDLATLNITSVNSLTAISTSYKSSFRHLVEKLSRWLTTFCDDISSRNLTLDISFHLKDIGNASNCALDFFGFIDIPDFNIKDSRQWQDQFVKGDTTKPVRQDTRQDIYISPPYPPRKCQIWGCGHTHLRNCCIHLSLPTGKRRLGFVGGRGGGEGGGGAGGLHFPLPVPCLPGPSPFLVVPSSVCFLYREELRNVMKFISYFNRLPPPWISRLSSCLLLPPVDFSTPLLSYPWVSVPLTPTPLAAMCFCRECGTDKKIASDHGNCSKKAMVFPDEF